MLVYKLQLFRNGAGRDKCNYASVVVYCSHVQTDTSLSNQHNASLWWICPIASAAQLASLDS